MYKYNKYKQKYLNLLYGGSSGFDNTFNINIYNLAGDILCNLTLNNQETITIEELIENIHDTIEEFNEYYLELVYGDMKVKYNNVLSKNNINDDDNNINLKLIKRNINLYDFFNNIMQNECDDESLILYLARKKKVGTYIDTLKICITPTPTTANDFFFLHNSMINIMLFNNNEFRLFFEYDRSDSRQGIYNNDSEWLYRDENFITKDYTYNFYQVQGRQTNNRMIIIITKNDNNNFTNDDLEYLLSLIEVVGPNINNMIRIYRNKLDYS